MTPTGHPVRLDYHVESARAWAAVLQQLLAPSATVVELCCGAAPKVVLALCQLGHRGSYIGVDASAAALAELEALITMLGPSFAWRTVCSDFAAVQERGDVVVLNHVFDDLLLGPNPPYDNIEAFFASALQDPDVAARPLAAACERICAPAGMVIATDYPGYIERLVGDRRLRAAADATRTAFAAHMVAGPFRKQAPVKLLAQLADPYFGPDDVDVFARIDATR